MEFLLIILLIYFGFKLLRWLAVRSMQNRARKIFEQFTRQAGAQSQEPNPATTHRNKSGWDRPQKNKKINPDEGEYVEWEEVRIATSETTTFTETANPDGSTTTAIEQERITDVEWEDIRS